MHQPGVPCVTCLRCSYSSLWRVTIKIRKQIWSLSENKDNIHHNTIDHTQLNTTCDTSNQNAPEASPHGSSQNFHRAQEETELWTNERAKHSNWSERRNPQKPGKYEKNNCRLINCVRNFMHLFINSKNNMKYKINIIISHFKDKNSIIAHTYINTNQSTY